MNPFNDKINKTVAEAAKKVMEESSHHDFKVGDKVHLGMALKGGAGYEGTIHKIEDNVAHVKLEDPTSKWGPRILKGRVDALTKMSEGYKEDEKKAPFKGPYRDATKPKKDQFGNVIKNRAKNLAKQGMRGVHKEEVEQIDELKRDTLINYRSAVTKGSAARQNKMRDAMNAYDDDPKNKDLRDKMFKLMKKSDNRQRGYKTAGVQLGRGGARMRKEEVEQVAERLIGKQHKIDANKNGKIDAHDFKLLRNKTKKAKMNESYVLMEETTPALSASMKAILADAFHMYFKAHTFHWNVEGANFPEYHKFFGDIYEQLFDTIDPIAEEIRALGEYAPKSLDELKSSTSISTESADTPAAMFSALIADNNKIIAGLTSGYKIAEAAGEIGLSNFLQDKIDAHKKLGWMIKSTSKGA